jgi:hypothetical protein
MTAQVSNFQIKTHAPDAGIWPNTSGMPVPCTSECGAVTIVLAHLASKRVSQLGFNHHLPLQ